MDTELAWFGADAAKGVAAVQAIGADTRSTLHALNTRRSAIDDFANGASSATNKVAGGSSLFEDRVGDNADCRSQKHQGFDRKRIERNHFD